MRPLTAVDLFAGAGGATEGLTSVGYRVLGAVENDSSARTSYALNHPEVRLWNTDIRLVKATAMLRELGLKPRDLTVLKACPPCQGFSSLSDGRSKIDERQNDLILDVVRFVRAFRPSAVIIENVPGLAKDRRLATVREKLSALGYSVRQFIVNASDFGVPQRRKRLILLAIRGRRRVMPARLPLDQISTPVPARVAFSRLEEYVSSGTADSLHVARRLTAKVRQRVAAVPVNGTRFDLPVEHQLECHKRVDVVARNATGSYGRIKLSEPAPTMTTRCTTPACGSFIHPFEDRGITLREAAMIQTFPASYQFAGTYGEVERQIGNAVPVEMAGRLGQDVLTILGLTSKLLS